MRGEFRIAVNTSGPAQVCEELYQSDNVSRREGRTTLTRTLGRWSDTERSFDLLLNSFQQGNRKF